MISVSLGPSRYGNQPQEGMVWILRAPRKIGCLWVRRDAMNAQAAALLESNGLKPTLGRATLSGIADEMSTYEIPWALHRSPTTFGKRVRCALQQSLPRRDASVAAD
jgi:hypothetical protein